MDASCSTSVEETFVIKVNDKHQNQLANRSAESVHKIEEIPEEETVEEEIIPDIPIVITDDAILNANDECTGNTSRPQNRAGCRHILEDTKAQTQDTGRQEEIGSRGGARPCKKPASQDNDDNAKQLELLRKQQEELERRQQEFEKQKQQEEQLRLKQIKEQQEQIEQ